ncbi:MAG: hypothetical protein AAB779_02890, partial [Patescibacteria group bacterium]
MKKLGHVLFWLFFLILVWGCDRKSPNGPEIPDPAAMISEKPASLGQSALQESLPQNLEISLPDLLGRELPESQVFVGYGYVMADTVVWRLNDFQGSSNGIRFYGPAFPGDFDGNGLADFADFRQFADVFGLKFGQVGYDALFDFDESGQISWQDFFVFADFFGFTASGVVRSAKPVPLPDSPPREGLGLMSHADLLLAWPVLTRSAKTAAIERQYQFRIKSLDKVFSDTTVTVTGEIFGSRRFTFPINAAPRYHGLGPLALNSFQGATGKIPLLSLFDPSDDQLVFSLSGDTTGLAIADSFLAIDSRELRQFTFTVKATDTAKQFALAEVVAAVIAPPDTMKPTVMLAESPGGVRLVVEDNSGPVLVHVVQDSAITVFSGTYQSPLDTLLALENFGEGTHVLGAWAMDVAGNEGFSEVITVKVILPDRTPPTAGATGEWVGDRKNILSLNVSITDNKGVGPYSVKAG